MEKEKKLGLALIGMLFLTLAVVAIVRMRSRFHASDELVDTPPPASAIENTSSAAPRRHLLDRLDEPQPSPVKLATAESEVTEAPSAQAVPAEPASSTPPYATALTMGDRYASPTPSADPAAAPDPFQPPPTALTVAEATPAAEPSALQPSDGSTPVAADPAGAPQEPPHHHHEFATEMRHEPTQPAQPSTGGATLLGVEPELAQQTAHEETDERRDGEHAVGEGHRYREATHAVHGHPATPQSPQAAMGDRYVMPPQGAHPPHYDIYGRDLPKEADPPVAQHYAPPEHVPMAEPSQQPNYGMPSEPRVEPPRHHHQGQETYTIRPNDTFWRISEHAYGTGSYFKALEEHNRERSPYSDRLRVGDVVSTPPVNYLEEKYPDLCPKRRNVPPARSVMSNASLPGMNPGLPGSATGRMYTVQQGDTLFDIARGQLGKASRWAEIYDLNRDRLGEDFDFLAPGTQLMMPESRAGGEAREPLTTQSRPPYNR
ncbi:MAG TPA: LysM peptidoglycan-binding domain-containing protein [Pirellulales bacterium]|jgi:nucleoid-associated protein YgaU|nr:LysM peptidoglycan-binding domain-containing protein [Pirellulales bacterium]